MDKSPFAQSSWLPTASNTQMCGLLFCWTDDDLKWPCYPCKVTLCWILLHILLKLNESHVFCYVFFFPFPNSLKVSVRWHRLLRRHWKGLSPPCCGGMHLRWRWKGGAWKGLDKRAWNGSWYEQDLGVTFAFSMLVTGHGKLLHNFLSKSAVVSCRTKQM